MRGFMATQRPLPDSEAYERIRRRTRRRRFRLSLVLLLLLSVVGALVYLLAGGPLPDSLSWLEAVFGSGGGSGG